MRDREINPCNVDDVVRAALKAGKKSLRWGKNGKRSLLMFIEASTTNVFTGKGGYKPRKDGFTFMGMKHYWKSPKTK